MKVKTRHKQNSRRQMNFPNYKHQMSSRRLKLGHADLETCKSPQETIQANVINMNLKPAKHLKNLKCTNLKVVASLALVAILMLNLARFSSGIHIQQSEGLLDDLISLEGFNSSATDRSQRLNLDPVELQVHNRTVRVTNSSRRVGNKSQSGADTRISYRSVPQIISKPNKPKLELQPLVQAAMISSRQSQLPNYLHQRTSDGATRSFGQHLPNGPPPFRPTKLMLALSGSGALRRVKSSKLFKLAYKSKVYYLFLDTLRQLTLLADKLSRAKKGLMNAHLDALQVGFSKLTWKGGHWMKLKWPLVMLNPHFIRELLSNPTFLVMLFHAVEVAYISMPIGGLLLKPLIKMVAQRSPEKEEQIWWRRKRLYDVLNGQGSSEMQPNLKSLHFRHPGRPGSFAMPHLVHFYRQLTNRPAPNPSSYSQPNHPTVYSGFQADHEYEASKQIVQSSIDDDVEGSQLHFGQNSGDQRLESMMGPISDYLTFVPKEQMMSQDEFNSLDPREKDQILKETQERLEESRFTDDLIRQHYELIDSLKSPIEPMSSNDVKQAGDGRDSASDLEWGRNE